MSGYQNEDSTTCIFSYHTKKESERADKTLYFSVYTPLYGSLKATHL